MDLFPDMEAQRTADHDQNSQPASLENEEVAQVAYESLPTEMELAAWSSTAKIVLASNANQSLAAGDRVAQVANVIVGQAVDVWRHVQHRHRNQQPSLDQKVHYLRCKVWAHRWLLGAVVDRDASTASTAHPGQIHSPTFSPEDWRDMVATFLRQDLVLREIVSGSDHVTRYSESNGSRDSEWDRVAVDHSDHSQAQVAAAATAAEANPPIAMTSATVSAADTTSAHTTYDQRHDGAPGKSVPADHEEEKKE